LDFTGRISKAVYKTKRKPFSGLEIDIVLRKTLKPFTAKNELIPHYNVR
jgi:hypothetical protein